MKSVYLDTTVPSHLHDQREDLVIRYRREITKKWWESELKKYEVFISDFTLTELERGCYPGKEQVLASVAGIPVLKLYDEIIAIAQFYIDNYVMPKQEAGDAFHLACASFHKVDFLLTWNCNHLANANKFQHVRTANSKLKLFTPEIVTPEELFEEA